MRNLSKLREGEATVVVGVEPSCPMRGRLFDLGLAPGTRVLCAHKNHAGDLAAYVIRGAVLALRAEDAERVTVR
jgi:ferrous iron transport protein A